jgi:hypothetical protein
MASVMMGIDPHKASHTAVAISGSEERLGELRVRPSGAQAERLLAWAGAWPERTWAVEGADGPPGPPNLARMFQSGAAGPTSAPLSAPNSPGSATAR